MLLIYKLYGIWNSKTITFKLLSLIIVVFSLFSLSVIVYVDVIAKNSMTKKVIISQHKELNTQIEYVNNELKQLELSSVNWALRIKDEIESRLNEEELTYDNTKTIRKDLASLEIGNLLIQEVFIYVDATVPYSIKAGENWKEYNNQQDRFFFKNFDKNKEISWKRIETNSGNKLIFSYKLSSQNSKIQKNLIVIINDLEFNNMIEATQYDTRESIILKDVNNYIFISSEDMLFHLNEIHQKVNESPNGTIKIMEKSYIYYKKDAELISDTWTYVLLSPIDNAITQFIPVFNNIIIWIICLTCLINIIIWLGTKKLHSPIQQLFHIIKVPDSNNNNIENVIIKWRQMEIDKNELEQKINRNNLLLVENSFKELLQNEKAQSNSFVKNKLFDLEWDLENKKIILVNFVLTDILSNDIDVTDDDDLCYYMSENIITEKVLEIYKEDTYHLTVMTLNGILSMVLIDENNYDREREKLINLANSILNQINRFVGRHMVITISSELEGFAETPNMYKKMVEFRSTREVEEVNIILDMVEDSKPALKEGYIYPIKFEKEIIQGIYLNDKEAVFQGLNRVERNIRDQKLQVGQMRLIFLQMLNSLRHEVIKMGVVSEQVIVEIDSVFLKLNSCEYLGQANSLIWVNILSPLLGDREQDNIEQEKVYSNKVLYFIQNHYQEEDFSLEWCARQIEVDEFVLSKTFKKSMGINFIDYLTKTRLDKAIELLLTTTYPIAVIAQMIGYQSNYFSRIFKSKIGESPGEYRKKRK